jgi:uroporphyrinogen III methyltransferase / synthase
MKAVMKKGKVYLVGAGPGDAGLITVRGAELLRMSDCIVYDRLANPLLLRYAKEGAEIIEAGKRAGSHSYKQHEINELLVDKAKVGKTIVRLKGGDPVIFGRGAEEAASLAEAGIEFEFVPGITAAVGAAEYAGIMLTHRDYSSAVAFVTSHEADDKQASGINWKSLAKFEGTLVFYMGVGNLKSTSKELVKNGMSADMPAAVVADATLPSQRIVTAKIADIAQAALDENIEPPAILIVGRAAQPDQSLSWFTRKPLFGQCVIATRDVDGNAELAEKVLRQGGLPLEFTVIEMKSLMETMDFQKALKHVGSYDWVVFTSANGVELCFEALGKAGKDARVFKKACIAAIGDITARRLKECGIVADFVPDVFTGRELAKQLAKFENLKGRKVLLLRSAIASKELADALKKAGAAVEDVPLYTTQTAKSDPAAIIDAIQNDRADWLTFTSASAVRGLFEQVETGLVKRARVRIASIGPATTEQLKKLGLKVAVEAMPHTTDGLVDAMCRSVKK